MPHFVDYGDITVVQIHSRQTHPRQYSCKSTRQDLDPKGPTILMISHGKLGETGTWVGASSVQLAHLQ